MPKLSVWMIRAALIDMGIGFLFGALILWHKGSPIAPWIWRLLNLHIELMIFGWTMQIIMGTAFFVLPRFGYQKKRYGAERLGWLSFYLLNFGILTTAISYWFAAVELALFGRVLTITAVVAYVVMIWPRVKPFAIEASSRLS